MNPLGSKDPRNQNPGLMAMAAEHLASPSAAGLALLPVYPLFERKAHLQLEMAPPPLSGRTVVNAAKTLPPFMLAAGVQFAALNKLDKVMSPTSNDQQEEEQLLPQLGRVATCGVAVGAVSCYPLAVVNKVCSGESLLSATKSHTLRGLGAVTGREAAFLTGVKGGDVVGTAVKKQLGDSDVVEQSTRFGVGAMGSLLGHPFDTVATRLPKPTQLGSLYKGSGTRAVAVGAFSVLYGKANKYLNPPQLEPN